ncbi:MAG: uncharacterized protein QOH84_6238, partial [Kribbellaceae bacterium]|nr:uncharacterized protein [Kribbellaceae bacterium]
MKSARRATGTIPRLMPTATVSVRRTRQVEELSRGSDSVGLCAAAPRVVLDVHLRGSGARVSDNQWGPPGQYPPQQPPPGGQGPYQPGQYPQPQGGYPQPQGGYPPPPGQIPPPGPFAPQPWQQPLYGGGRPPGQQLPQGLGWGAPPRGPQRPKKKGPALAILLVVGGLVGAVVLLSVISGFLKHNDSADSPYYTPTSDPSYSPTYDPTPDESPTVGPSTAPPTYRPTTTKPTVTKPTAPRTSVTPPVKRGPTDYEMVSRNKLYSSGVMASVGCRESRARQSTAAGAT